MGIFEPRCLLSGFVQTNLDSDLHGLAAVTDPNLRNPWGISMSPIGPFWFGDNAAGVSDLVDGGGNVVPLVITIPGPGGVTGSPTGTVFNVSSGFVVSENGKSAPALFLFAGEDGTISGWSPAVDATQSIVMAHNPSAVFKGLALATVGGQTLLYAADFRTGTVDVFNQSFHAVQVRGGFTDPAMPAGFAPFGIQAIGPQIFVTYAKQDGQRYEDVPGAGNGFVDVFSADGQLLHRLVSGGVLDSPWGITLAPSNFGAFSHDLLIGNAGDGRIHAFDANTGALQGTLTDVHGNALQNGRLWALTFGNGHEGGATDTLYFAAGLDGEQHGLFGMIQPADRPDAGHIAGADQGANGSNPYDPTSGDDAYPLPPSQGPTLTTGAGRPVPLVAVLMPLQSTSIALAPTLLSLPSAPASPAAPASQPPASPTTTLVSLPPTGLLASSLFIIGNGAEDVAAGDPQATDTAPSLASLLNLDSESQVSPPLAEETALLIAALPGVPTAAHPVAAVLHAGAGNVAPTHAEAHSLEHATVTQAGPECPEAASVGQTLVELIETETGSDWKPIVSVVVSLTAAGYLWRRRLSWRPTPAPIPVEPAGNQRTMPVEV